jgi:hypothetical protein
MGGSLRKTKGDRLDIQAGARMNARVKQCCAVFMPPDNLADVRPAL